MIYIPLLILVGNFYSLITIKLYFLVSTKSDSLYLHYKNGTDIRKRPEQRLLTLFNASLFILLSQVFKFYISSFVSGLHTFYSNSIVPGGFPVQSYSTRFTCATSFTIRLVTFCSTLHGISAASAVMKSTVFTARKATA